MFDARLKKGVVFTIDSDAAKEFELDQGVVFAISRDANAVEVRASRFKDGKPARGRPRKFPTAAVARMLGITDLDLPTSDADETEAVADVDEAEDAADEATGVSEARVAQLIANAGDGDDEPW